jgi:hypothetical protein
MTFRVTRSKSMPFSCWSPSRETTRLHQPYLIVAAAIALTACGGGGGSNSSSPSGNTSTGSSSSGGSSTSSASSSSGSSSTGSSSSSSGGGSTGSSSSSSGGSSSSGSSSSSGGSSGSSGGPGGIAGNYGDLASTIYLDGFSTVFSDPRPGAFPTNVPNGGKGYINITAAGEVTGFIVSTNAISLWNVLTVTGQPHRPFYDAAKGVYGFDISVDNSVASGSNSGPLPTARTPQVTCSGLAYLAVGKFTASNGVSGTALFSAGSSFGAAAPIALPWTCNNTVGNPSPFKEIYLLLVLYSTDNAPGGSSSSSSSGGSSSGSSSGGTSPAVALSPTSLDFGSSHAPSLSNPPITNAVGVGNASTATENISSSISGDPSFYVDTASTQCLGGPVLPGQACAISVSFAPSPTTCGAVTATLLISYGGQTPASVPLTGTGLGAAGSTNCSSSGGSSSSSSSGGSTGGSSSSSSSGGSSSSSSSGGSSSSSSSSGGSSSSSSSSGGGPATYTVGGTVSGLPSGTRMVLDNNGFALDVFGNGAFTFPAIPAGDSYLVTVPGQLPGFYCTIANGSGTILAANVTNVYVTCTPSLGYAYVVVNNNLAPYVAQYVIGAYGALTPATTPNVLVGHAPSGMIITGTNAYGGTNAYISDAKDGVVYQFFIDGNGVLTPMNPSTIASGLGSNCIAVDPTGRYVYVANYTDGSVSQYGFGVNGALAALSPASLPTGVGPTSVTADASGQYVYVANSGFTGSGSAVAATLSQYSIGATGALAPLSPATVSTSSSHTGCRLSVAATSQNAYAVTTCGETFQYAIGSDGVLSPLSPATVAAGGIGGAGGVGILINKAYGYVYEAGDAGSDILQFTMGPTGLLTPMSPSSVAGGGINSLAFDPTENYLYDGSWASFFVDQYAIGVGGPLISLSPSYINVSEVLPVAIATVHH